MPDRSTIIIIAIAVLGLGALLYVIPGTPVYRLFRTETVTEASAGGDASVEGSASGTREFKIVSLLPRDGIPAILNPTFLTVEEASETMISEELVLGVSFNGDSRAYSVPFLSSHEIVNDTVGGVPIAVTW